MKIDEPKIAAAAMSSCRAHAPGTCPSPFYRCRVDAIRADRAHVAEALSAALESPDTFPALRSLLSALSGQGTDVAPPLDLAAQVRARLGSQGQCRVTWDLLDGGAEPFRIEWRRWYEDAGISDRRNGEATTADEALRSVLKHEDWADAQDPPTEPGPTESTDLLLRTHYIRKMSGGYFGDDLGVPMAFMICVHALRVRLVYVYAPADREAAEDMARVWEARLRERGARAVEMVGEEET